MAFSSDVSNQARGKNYNLSKDFYSGSQASIFIGDLWVDDICEWQCQASYSAAPIYGYGDQLYSHVAEGKMLVQGSFSINFREPNYLWAILERFNFRTKTEEKTNPLKSKGNLGNTQFNQSEASFANDKRVNLDYFFNSANPNEMTEALIKDRGFSKETADTEDIDFKAKTFDITLGYGAELDQDSPGERILGVKVIGKSKVIFHDGNPIKEQYNFFARNII
jgi:hypothetical protein